MTWEMPTDQEMFDNAALGIIGQEYEVAYEAGDCVVRSYDGKSRCALGHSIPDAEAGAKVTPAWYKMANTRLGNDLRIAHDITLYRCGRDHWVHQMAKIALKFGLDDSVLYFKETK